MKPQLKDLIDRIDGLYRVEWTETNGNLCHITRGVGPDKDEITSFRYGYTADQYRRLLVVREIFNVLYNKQNHWISDAAWIDMSLYEMVEYSIAMEVADMLRKANEPADE